MNYLKRVRGTTSTNFINNLYIGVNEASNPLPHRKSSTTSSQNRFLVTQRLFFRCLNHPIWLKRLIKS
ncbi:MAG: hypothetical protein PHT13_12410, partial [Methanosarcina sp.]|nr:hypothetical protein [Methanosarcina sp.]